MTITWAAVGGLEEAAGVMDRLRQRQAVQQRLHPRRRHLAGHRDAVPGEGLDPDRHLRMGELAGVCLMQLLAQRRRRQPRGLHLVDQLRRDHAVGTHHQTVLVELGIALEAQRERVAGLDQVRPRRFRRRQRRRRRLAGAADDRGEHQQSRRDALPVSSS